MSGWRALRLLLGSPEIELQSALTDTRHRVANLETHLARAESAEHAATAYGHQKAEELLEAIKLLGQLKREGFVALPDLPVRAAEGELEDDPIMEALHSRAHPGTQLWNELCQYVSALRRQDLTPEEIAGHVLQGAAEVLDQESPEELP